MALYLMNIIKWFNRTFFGIVYAEDSVPMSDTDPSVVLDLTPKQLRLLKKEKINGHSLSKADNWDQD